MSSNRMHNLALTAVMTAVICAVAPLSIPLGAVPFSLQTLIIPLIATVCAPSVALTATALYLLIGGLGLPVFAGYTGSFMHFLTPTGGYLIGMLLFPIVIGGLLHWRRSATMVLTSNLVAGLLQLIAGSIWLSALAGMPLQGALMTGAVAFIPALLVKTGIVFVCERALSRSGVLTLLSNKR